MQSANTKRFNVFFHETNDKPGFDTFEQVEEIVRNRYPNAQFRGVASELGSWDFYDPKNPDVRLGYYTDWSIKAHHPIDDGLAREL